MSLDKGPLYIGTIVNVFGIASYLGPILGGALADSLN